MIPNTDKLNADDDDFQSEIHRHLKKLGLAFPETPAEVDHFFSLVDKEVLPLKIQLPTAHDILARGMIELVEELNASTDPIIEENLSQAAREGGEISDEVHRRMEQDRENSENKNVDDK
jgi:hypothetical protein